jgi:hypothetical protein
VGGNQGNILSDISVYVGRQGSIYIVIFCVILCDISVME